MTFRHDRYTADDFYQLSDVLQGWETQPVQLSPGALNLSLETITSAHITLLKLSLSPRVADRAIVHQGSVGFVLVERPQTWCGIEINQPAIIIMQAGRETRSVLEANFSSTEFYFPEQVIYEHALGSLLSNKLLDPEQAVFPITHFGLKQIISAADSMKVWGKETAYDFESDILDSAAAQRFLDLLHSLLKTNLTGLVNDNATFTYRKRVDLAHSALEAIDEINVSDLSLPKVYEHLGVTSRAVELAFKSVLGMSPGQYLLAYRMNHAKKTIVELGSRVGEAATMAGFNDLGRFAHRYHALFAELPSTTLKRRTIKP